MNLIQKMMALASLMMAISEGAGGMIVWVRNSETETPIACTMKSDATVADLRAQATAQGILPGIFMFQGKQLPNYGSLADAGVPAESVLDVVRGIQVKVELYDQQPIHGQHTFGVQATTAQDFFADLRRQIVRKWGWRLGEKFPRFRTESEHPGSPDYGGPWLSDDDDETSIAKWRAFLDGKIDLSSILDQQLIGWLEGEDSSIRTPLVYIDIP